MVVLGITSANLLHNEVYTYVVSLNGALGNSHLSEGKSTMTFIIGTLYHMLIHFLFIH
jgi:hypothetical protein